ncbi:glycoside hydrolase [candidate division KSB1 bacterium]|nr:glycoside hydrolase [candidate division KSB1 bacterium]RQW04431.1 MAG: glycoside hydrolase [candidate division KSB1 bacterium]
MALVCSSNRQNSISLAGQWFIKLDRQDVGIEEEWFDQTFTESVQLPGALQAQGYGEKPNLNTPWIGGSGVEKFDLPHYAKYAPYITDEDYKHPFWLTPDKYYRGVAWYQKEIDIPKVWEGDRILLTLERCHWETTVYLDDHKIGSDSSLVTPHVYDLSRVTSPGKHLLSIRVNNDLILNVGPNSHSVSDHTQSNWNGFVGDILLRASSSVYIADVKIFPDIVTKSARVRIKVRDINDRDVKGRLILQLESSSEVKAQQRDIDVQSGETIEMDYPMGEDVKLWDEFAANLYTMTVQLATNHGTDEKKVQFGMREFKATGTRFEINGRPVFLRGTLDCCIFPKTGYPPTDPVEWERIFATLKKHGLNHMRFHSWCPPNAAFVAADKIGFYLHVEGPSWANQGASLGENRPIDRFIYSETRRILDEYGNHPSFVLYAYGNEPAGQNQNKFLGEFVNYWREQDPRRLYTSAAGWPMIPENDYHVTPAPRIQQWGQGLNSIINAQPPQTSYDWRDFVSSQSIPVVGHEIGQWCVYPNFAEMSKYSGYLKPKNFEIFYDLLKRNHMDDQAHDFFMASGTLQALCYKAEIEAALRTPGFAGFQLLDIHDFPGQGTALVGILDPFYESKPYISAEAFRQFCGITVPLARLQKRLYTRSELFEAELEVAHFGAAPITDAEISWSVKAEDGTIQQQGQFSSTIAIDNCQKIGSIKMMLAKIAAPQKLTLQVTVADHGYNTWDFWVYPDEIDLNTQDILITNVLSNEVIDKLLNGANVLLNLFGKIREGKGAEVAIGFSSVFWNTAWTSDQAPHTLGILCDPQHPVFADFPTEYHSNWQWWDIIHSSQAMILDDLPPALRPIIQPIDTWFYARRLGLLFEAHVGQGKIVVCSIDFAKDLESRLASRQLYAGLLAYMHSDKFAPKHSLELDTIIALYQ